MPLYGVPQAGWNLSPFQGLNLTCIIPGDSFTLFDGTETPSAGLKSVAVNRGISPSYTDTGLTVYVAGAPSGCTVAVEGSNIDKDGDYFSISTISPDANGNGAYTDTGRAAFYRVVLATYTGGAMPVVTIQR